MRLSDPGIQNVAIIFNALGRSAYELRQLGRAEEASEVDAMALRPRQIDWKRWEIARGWASDASQASKRVTVLSAPSFAQRFVGLSGVIVEERRAGRLHTVMVKFDADPDGDQRPYGFRADEVGL